MHERLHRLDIVVHAGEQDALVSERNARVREALERLFHFHGELARMIDMDAHPERMIFFEHGAKLRRDALRQKNRNARADPEKLNVRNSAKAAENALEFFIAENEGVAAGEKHVAHFGVLFEITKGFLEIGVELLFAHAAHDATPGAVTAVTRTTIRDEKEDAIGIPMNEAGHRHM